MASPTRTVLAAFFIPVGLLSAPAVHAKPPGNRLALTLDATAPAVPAADHRWSNLWSTAGEVAASPQLVLGGKRVTCGPAYDAGSLLKLDFTGFQLNMDVDLDDEQERFDTVRLAYRSCWR